MGSKKITSGYVTRVFNIPNRKKKPKIKLNKKVSPFKQLLKDG